MNVYREITDQEWDSISPLLPETRPRQDTRGRPLRDTRSIINGVLWIISTQASWSSLPRTFPPYQTCHRRFKLWHEKGALEGVLEQLFGEEKEKVYTSMLQRMRQTRSMTDSAQAQN
jgi:transposase